VSSARPGGHPDVVAALRRVGIPADAIRRAVDRGDPLGAIFEPVLLPRIAARTVSANEIEAAGGLTAAAIAELTEAFGLPAGDPAKPAFTPSEAQVMIELARVEDIWPAELRIRGARVYGRQLARIAHTEVQQFRTHVEPRLSQEAGDPLAGLRAVQSAVERLQTIAESLLIGVHQRWLEHELGQAAIGQAELAAGEHELPGAADVTIVFCDLKDFTAYADLQGDAAAVGAIERFVEVVTRERGVQVRLMKSLGDGVMLVYGDTHEAVAATARIVAVIRDEAGPGVHASIHRGVAIAREGDYFGAAVNLAARLLAAAGRDEIVASEAVARATGDYFSWESAGDLLIRGFTEPVKAFRLAQG